MNQIILEALARRLTNQPESWSVFYWECLGRPAIGWRLKGAVAPLKTRGPGKGQPAWSKLDKTTLREIVIGTLQYEVFEADWVARTGKCPKCAGAATEFFLWTREEGTKTRPCPACEGTGQAARARFLPSPKPEPAKE